MPRGIAWPNYIGGRGHKLEAICAHSSHSATRLGFINVLDAFHVINQEEIPVRLFHKDFKRGSKRLILTDKTIELARSLEASSVAQETESRWNLIETAWELGMSANTLSVEYDGNEEHVIAEGGNRRTNGSQHPRRQERPAHESREPSS